MSNFAWYGLQFVIAVGVFYHLHSTIGVEGYGYAPGAISLAIAFVVTWIISKTIDWWKARSLRRLNISEEPESNTGSGVGLSRHPSDSAKLIGRPRIGQDRR